MKKKSTQHFSTMKFPRDANILMQAAACYCTARAPPGEAYATAHNLDLELPLRISDIVEHFDLPWAAIRDNIKRLIIRSRHRGHDILPQPRLEVVGFDHNDTEDIVDSDIIALESCEGWTAMLRRESSGCEPGTRAARRAAFTWCVHSIAIQAIDSQHAPRSQRWAQDCHLTDVQIYLPEICSLFGVTSTEVLNELIPRMARVNLKETRSRELHSCPNWTCLTEFGFTPEESRQAYHALQNCEHRSRCLDCEWTYRDRPWQSDISGFEAREAYLGECHRAIAPHIIPDLHRTVIDFIY